MKCPKPPSKSIEMSDIPLKVQLSHRTLSNRPRIGLSHEVLERQHGFLPAGIYCAYLIHSRQIDDSRHCGIRPIWAAIRCFFAVCTYKGIRTQRITAGNAETKRAAQPCWGAALDKVPLLPLNQAPVNGRGYWIRTSAKDFNRRVVNATI